MRSTDKKKPRMSWHSHEAPVKTDMPLHEDVAIISHFISKINTGGRYGEH